MVGISAMANVPVKMIAVIGALLDMCFTAMGIADTCETLDVVGYLWGGGVLQ